MKVLITGFDPFGGEEINPASEAVKCLPDQIGDIEICKMIVPTVFGKSIALVTETMEKIQPDAVICVGQAGGRAAITVERVAINCNDAGIEDNEGYQPTDEPVVPDGPAAYFSTLPIKKMVAAMKEAGIEAGISNTAGTFVCNHLMYGVLDYAKHMQEMGRNRIQAGFVHVPFIPQQTEKRNDKAPCMELKEIAAGLEAAIGCLSKKDAEERNR